MRPDRGGPANHRDRRHREVEPDQPQVVAADAERHPRRRVPAVEHRERVGRGELGRQRAEPHRLQRHREAGVPLRHRRRDRAHRRGLARRR